MGKFSSSEWVGTCEGEKPPHNATDILVELIGMCISVARCKVGVDSLNVNRLGSAAYYEKQCRTSEHGGCQSQL